MCMYMYVYIHVCMHVQINDLCTCATGDHCWACTTYHIHELYECNRVSVLIAVKIKFKYLHRFK